MTRAAREKTRYPGVYRRETRDGARFDVAYRDASGRMTWASAYADGSPFPSAKAASEERGRLVLAAKAGESPTSMAGRAVTFGDFVEREWLPRVNARIAEGTLRESSAVVYRSDLRTHLLPRLAERRLSSIKVDDVEALAAELLTTGGARGPLSPDSARRVVNLLGGILRYARKRGRITYNPVEDADKPAPRRRTPDLPTLDQLARLAACARREDDARLARFLWTSGVRIGEAFGLGWEHVDLTEGAERVRLVDTVYDGKRRRATKTAASAREVVLAPAAAAVLREQSIALQLGDRPNPFGLVFPSPGGFPWRASNFNRRVWQPMRLAAGLPDLKPHDLRYVYVSHVRASGLPAALTEQLVGHADARTHRGYTRPIEGTESIIRDALGRAFQ